MTQAPRAPVSCYIRACNEAARIERTVAAALAAVEEVVVVDSGSSDGTPERARAAGARVLEQRWLGNGAQKRVGERACRHDWVLDLDADEVVSDALADEIRALFASGEPVAAGYRLRLDYVSPIEERAALGRAWRLKLYDRRRAGAPDHALWDAAVPEPGARIERLSAPVRHFAFPSLDALAARLVSRATRNARFARPRPLWRLRLRILFGLPVYLFKTLVSRRMIRGGTYGFAAALIIALGRWLRDVRMWELAHGLGEREPR